MTTELSNFIHGEHVAAADGRTADIVDPSSGEAYATAPLSGEADIDAAFRDSARAFEEWRDTTPSERQLALLRIADAIERRGEDRVVSERARGHRRAKGRRRAPGCGGRSRAA